MKLAKDGSYVVLELGDKDLSLTQDQILKNQAIVSIVLNELNLRETGKEYDADPDKLLDKVKEVLDATN
ncbi:hypothetical protein LCGC14_2774350 [marine sediment metagenome]|uniref:Uncharacterized protein n=1 Tax=marine sediment metagenome TaxID=412755 RepID=A0A0F8YV47_9ZZZZ